MNRFKPVQLKGDYRKERLRQGSFRRSNAEVRKVRQVQHAQYKKKQPK